MGIIYEILCWTTGLRYIGKTTLTLKQRLTNHKCSTTCSSKLVIEHGNFEIYELEKVDDETLLKKREFYYIQHTDCVNMRTGDVDVKATRKKYYQSEKGKINHRKNCKAHREKKKLEKSLLK